MTQVQNPQTTEKQTSENTTRESTNGVDVAALKQTLDAVRQEPSLAAFHFRATNRWLGGARNRSTIKGRPAQPRHRGPGVTRRPISLHTTPSIPKGLSMSRTPSILCTLVALALPVLSAAAAPHGGDAHGGQAAKQPAAEAQQGAPLFDDLGNHHHPVTTNSEQAQRYFDQGLVLAYGFNHPEAERSFREAARLDPGCAMAWWGAALVLGPNINKPMDKADAPKAWEALQKARELAPGAREKERAYIEALSKRYAQNPPEDRSALDRSYADAMKEVAGKYPDDLDAATLAAEAIMDTIPWQYWTKDNQPKEETKHLLALLEGVLEKKHDHPGACHYYIHAVEAAQPEKALAAADTLRTLVPGAGHLVHMPAHIYLRLGLYREATLANELAAAADESYINQCRAQGFYPSAYYPHNVHFLWYTNAMEGRSRDSIDAAKKIAEHGKHAELAEGDRFEPLVPMAMVRFGRWDDVLAQPRPKGDEPFAAAMSHYTRGLALAAKGDLEQARSELAALERIAADDNTKALDTDLLPGASLITIARHDLAGHIALKEGRHDEAIAELTNAVELEDALPYMEPPFCYMPMRHGLGAGLLAAGKAQEAEKVYREDLRRHPHNGWALLGLTQSLREQGKDALAEEVMQRFELAWVRADVRPASSRL